MFLVEAAVGSLAGTIVVNDVRVLLTPQQRRKPGARRMQPEVTVDARGTRCPVPISELSRAVETPTGTVIELLADDPNARVDVPVWCRLKRHELIEVTETDGTWRFVLRA